MSHRVFVHAADSDTLSAVALAVGGIGCEGFPFGNRVIGYIDIPALSVRRALRNDARVAILPNRQSPTDASAHGKALGLNAKTARDIFAAVFSATNADIFDPDL